MSRQDLISLGEAEIVALANRGLYKRAQKMMAKGGYELQVESDSTVVLTVDGVEARLSPDVPLADTGCSCGASSVCRHRILAILAYQESEQSAEAVEEEWCPGDFADEELKDFAGASVWRRAVRLRSRGLRIKLQRGSKPAALLPTCNVAFLVPNQIQYGRCDCSQEGPCEHLVLACWAFREEGDVVAFDRPAEKVELDFTLGDQCLEELLTFGATSAENATVEALQEVQKQCEKDGLIWLADLSGELAQSVEQYLIRGAGYSSDQHASLLLEWWTRTRASTKGSANTLLGLGESPETALEQSSLTCLGVRLYQKEESSRAELFFADSYNGVVTVLSRDWKESLAGDEFGSKRVSSQLTVGKLCTGRLVTEAAKRRANRALLLGRGRLGKNSVFTDRGDWHNRFKAPLLVEDFASLKQECLRREPALFRARLKAENLLILRVSEVESLSYSPGSQTLSGTLLDLHGEAIQLVAPYRRGEPRALAALARALLEEPSAVSGFVRFRNGQLEVEPLSVVTDRVVCPALASVEEFPELPFFTQPETGETLQKAWEICVHASHRGFKFVGGRWNDECQQLSAGLRSTGLPKLATRFDELGRDLTPEGWWKAALRCQLLLQRL